MRNTTAIMFALAALIGCGPTTTDDYTAGDNCVTFNTGCGDTDADTDADSDTDTDTDAIVVTGVTDFSDATMTIDGADCAGLTCIVPEYGTYLASLEVPGILVESTEVDVESSSTNADFNNAAWAPSINATYVGSRGTYDVKTFIDDNGVVWIDLGGGFETVEVNTPLGFSGTDEYGWNYTGSIERDAASITYSWVDPSDPDHPISDTISL